MLGLIILNFVLLLSVGESKSYMWYFRMWGLSLGSFYSLFLVYKSCLSSSFVTLGFMVDGLSSPLVVLTWWISLLSVMASQMSVKGKNNNFCLFIGCICFLNLILMLTFFSCDILWFYVFFEASLIPTLMLILGWGYQPERLQAGMYMMLYTITASLPLLFLILFSVDLSSTSSFLLKSMLGSASELSMFWNGSVISELMFLVGLLAFLVKVPMFSLHLWLPKAHVEAPVAGSMILAGVLLKLGGYGLIRMYQYFSFSPPGVMGDFILCFALWGGVIASFICFRQVDMKALIAYASVGHMSLMLVGILSNSPWGWDAALAMMLAHGLCSSGMFALANYNYEKTGTRSLLLNKGMLGICPILSMWWFLFCVVNMAAPPSINLLSEILVIPSALQISICFAVPLMMMSFLAAVYSLYLYVATQHGKALKFIGPSLGFSSSANLLLGLHYLPVNGLILKSDIISCWMC